MVTCGIAALLPNPCLARVRCDSGEIAFQATPHTTTNQRFFDRVYLFISRPALPIISAPGKMSPKKRKQHKTSTVGPAPPVVLPKHPEPQKELPVVLVENSTKRAKKRSYTLVFIIGGIVGLLVAIFFANNQDIIIGDFQLSALVDVIPAGILKEATDISVCQSGNRSCDDLPIILTSALGSQQREKDVVGADAFSVGLALKAEGLRANHPVIMVYLNTFVPLR